MPQLTIEVECFDCNSVLEAKVYTTTGKKGIQIHVLPCGNCMNDSYGDGYQDCSDGYPNQVMISEERKKENK